MRSTENVNRAGAALARAAGALADGLYPRSCEACGSLDTEGFRYLCWDCFASALTVQPPWCALCGDPVSGRVDHEYVCSLCSSRKIWFDLARSACRYDTCVADLLKALKYRAALWVLPDLLALVRPCLDREFDPADIDAVCAVPLHPLHERSRGYNQARLLANGIAHLLGRPLLRRGIRRVRRTPTQTRLTAAQRAANVKNAFAPARGGGLRGRRILLVDDVMTTGATVNECARALKSGGASKVFVLTVARG
jgi:ComF family protein